MNVACSTCLDSLTLESGISATPCGHVFHTDCITKWIESGQNNCSHCRADCQKKNFVKLFFSQNELGLQQNEVIDDISEENQKLLQQANEAKSRELEASRKVEKIQIEKFELKALLKTQNEVIDDISEENQKLLEQANKAKYRELEASRKVEKIQKERFELTALIKTLKNVELDVKRNFNKDKQDMLEQIEELKNEVTNLKLELKSNVELNVKRRFDKDKKGQKQIEGLKKEVTDLKSKLHKSEQDMLKQIEESLKEELNIKRNFDIEKQDRLEQIEELKRGMNKEVTDLQLKLKSLVKNHKDVERVVKRNINIDKQNEELKKEVTELKLELKSLMKTNEDVELFGKVKSRFLTSERRLNLISLAWVRILNILCGFET